MNLKEKCSAVFLLFAFICQLFLVTSCSSKIKYRDNIPCHDISEAFIQSQNNSVEYSYYTEEEISFLLDLPEYVNDLSVAYSTDANDIDEIGIFHCTDEKSAKEFFDTLSSYLSEQQATQKAFIESYAPREVPKLDAAEARRFGNYVIYTILSAEDKKTLLEITNEKLR